MDFFWPGILAVIALGAVLATTIMVLPVRCLADTPSIAIGHALLVAGCRDAIR